MSIYDIRLKNMNTLISRYRFIREFCDEAGIKQSYVTQIRSGDKNIGEKMARSIEEHMDLGSGWMDKDHDTESQQSDEPVLSHSTMSAAYAIESMSEPVKDAVRRLIFAIASETNKPAIDSFKIIINNDEKQQCNTVSR